MKEAELRGPDSRKANLVGELDSTLSTFIDAKRTTESSIFTVDRRVATVTQKDTPEVASALVRSDEKLARTSVNDAKRVVKRLRARNLSFEEDSVNREIKQAERALNRGDRLENKSSVAAIQQYYRAWLHAQTALDEMDTAVTPQVTVDNRVDPPHDESITYPIKGEVFDVRAYELETVTVFIDGQKKTVPLETNTTLGTAGAFSTNVTVENEINEINISSTDDVGDLGVVAGGMHEKDKQGKIELTERSGQRNNAIRKDAPRDRSKRDTNSERAGQHFESSKTEKDSGNRASETRGKSKDDDDEKKNNGKKKGEHKSGNSKNRQSTAFVTQVQLSLLETIDVIGQIGVAGYQIQDIPRYSALPRENRVSASPLAMGSSVGGTTFSEKRAIQRFQSSTGQDTRVQTGRDVLQLDGDRLPDTFEQNVVEMDPLDPDSDARTTNISEANDGITDGEETFNSSTLPIFAQSKIGADPFTNDTDNDGLTDEFELTKLGLLSNDVDSNDHDDDGIPDEQEDPDNDSLTNAQEQELGTDPLKPDTDEDGLTDDYEVENGHNPLTADRDEDGLDDGSEVRLGTNPATPDSDGDGISDGSETHTIRKSNKSAGASVTISGKGEINDGVTITNEENDVRFDAISTAESSFVELRSKRGFSSGKITLSYDESSISGAERGLGVFEYNERRGTFVRRSSDVDAQNDTITAKISRSSTYVVMDESAWKEKFKDPLPSKWGDEQEKFDSIDRSECEGECHTDGDTITVGSGSSVSSSISTSESFGFDGNFSIAGLCDPLCDRDGDKVPDFKDKCMSEPGIRPHGCPDSDGDGVYDHKDDCPDTYGKKDNGCPKEQDDDDDDNDGVPDDKDKCPDEPGENKNGCPESSYPVKTIEVGNNSEANLEIDVRGRVEDASSAAKVLLVGEFGHTREIYSINSNGGAVENGWQSVMTDLSDFSGERVTVTLKTTGNARLKAKALRVSRDSDGDGLTDAQERRGFRSGTGEVYYTDPNSADTDGDELPDGIEVSESTGNTYYNVLSNPEVPDSDGDGMPDSHEVEYGTKPFNKDTDGDGMEDSADVKPLNPPEEPKFNAKEKGRAFVNGAILGETGWKDGAFESDSAESPFYTSGWVLASVVPGVDIIADARDLAQNLASGDALEAALDAAGLIPIIGKAGDGAKAAKIVTKYVKRFPSKTKAASKVLTNVVLKYAPDSITPPVYKALGYGDEYARLGKQGLTPNDIEQLVTKLPKSESLSDVVTATKYGDQVIYLSKERLDHIVGRHISGTDYLWYTSYFPTGNVIKHIPGKRPKYVTPNKMSKADVEELIIETIEKGRPTDLPYKANNVVEYTYYSNKYGISNMKVRVNTYKHGKSPAGKIATAFPESGPAVKAWDENLNRYVNP